MAEFFMPETEGDRARIDALTQLFGQGEPPPMFSGYQWVPDRSEMEDLKRRIEALEMRAGTGPQADRLSDLGIVIADQIPTKG